MNRRLYKNRSFLFMQKAVTVLIVCFFAFSDLATLLSTPFLFDTKEAEAAQVTIDATTDATSAGSHTHSGPQTVFTNDQTGYKFYRDSSGECVYSKTTNGGTSWGSAVLVDDQGTGVDCLGIAVWYDRWTPGNTTGNFIHIATFDDGTDDVFYNRIDTANSDTRLVGSTAVAASAQANTNAVIANTVSITRGTDGTIYIAQDDTSDSFVVECTTNCNLTASWTETGTRPQDLANDYSLLVPLVGGNIMLINRDISAEQIRSKIWNNTAWSAAWTNIGAATANDNTTYTVGMAATVASSTSAATSSVYLAYITQNTTLGTDDDIRTARYQNGAWSNRTDVLTNDTKGLTSVAIARDENNGNIYVGYTGRTTAATAATGNVYWKSSTDQMGTWSTQTGPINSSADDMYGIDLNILSNQRIFASWFDNTDDDIYGDTIADLVPGVIVSANGSQTASLNAPFTNTHIGGSFVIAEQANSRDVTSITISENGTINGSTAVENIKLYYESDTVAPYNCASVSYGGTEAQFGSTDSNGFSGSDGTSAFSGTSVTVSTTSAMCVYVVLDVNDTVNSGETLNVQIADPSTEVSVTNSGEVIPATAVEPTGSTSILNDNLTQIHYHWRNDNGTEAAATSRTAGTQDTALTALAIGSPARLRIEVSNEGGISSAATQFRLEYAETTGDCSLASGWTDVGATNDDFNMNASANLTEGANTTNIATGVGGVTDENTTFLTPNGGVKETSSQTGSLTLLTTNYVELEYSIIASTTATQGGTYCFRVTDAGTPLKTYSVYPRATISADVIVSASGTQTTTTNIPTTNFYVGGRFIVTENTGSRNFTGMTITASGTVNAANDLSNPRLYMDFDITAPYDCASESYSGGETNVSGSAFSGANGSTTFSTTQSITTTRTLCAYLVVDVDATAVNGQKFDPYIVNPSTDVVVSGGGSVSPTIPLPITGITTLNGPVLTQIRSHWRNDNGTEAAATSRTAGVEDTAISDIDQVTPVRLRLEVSNEGTVTSASLPYRIEYGTKITNCSAISSWTDVGAVGGAFDMYNSANVTEGADTTNIATGVGGVTDENTTFLTPNSAVKETSSLVTSTTLSSTQYLEMEFSMQQTANAAFDTTYCFRVSNNGTPLQAYTRYPELTTAPERDFEVQRGFSDITGTSITLTAGVNYVAPSASTSAFIRITNSHHTGAGANAGGGNLNSDDVTAYILNPANIMTSVTIARPAAATGNTRVYWEIVEFIGAPGSDNEMIVRKQAAVTFGATSLTATATAATGILDDADVVVFVTGQLNPDVGVADYNTGQVTSQWISASNQAAFRRGEANADAIIVSYAVVEFPGVNWKVQRAEHTYALAGTTETESITAVNSLSRTFIHTQKRIGTNLPGTDEFGHEVWLSSIGAVSFFLESGATSPTLQTSVAWIIENTQTTIGAMKVTRSDGFTNGGVEPLTLSVAIGATLDDVSNASIFANTRGALTTNLHPRVIAGFRIASTTHYELWRSDTGAQMNYRTEVVEWPTAGLTFRQNDYRFYVDNDALLPTDPWPAGVVDLGENTVLTGADEPLGDGEHVRMRMSLTVANANFPEQSLNFKLQYGERVSTCSAISEINWNDVGATGSGAIWRGYNAPGVTEETALSGDPATGGDLLLSLSETAGTYEEANSSAVNPYTVLEGEEVEYDWHVQQNGANAETFYCFRMIRGDGTVFGAYDDYPQLRTSSFTAKTQNWRWYDDENNETPITALAAENIAPIDIANGSTTKLRVTVKETENIARDDVRFKLQYSEYADFANAYDVVATSSCTATSTWCYFNGGGADNDVISTKVLSDADSCTGAVGDGCGTHNESAQVATGFRHENSAATEYEFTITSRAPRANAVYYFRLYDVVQDIPVTTNTSESYPSLVIEGSKLIFNVSGLSSGTVIDGETLDVSSSPGSIAFGSLPFDTEYVAGYRLSISTNATEGYQVFMYADQLLQNEYGTTIAGVSGTNASPTNWAAGCSFSATGCFGYHAEDDSLSGLNPSRFLGNDTYAAMSTQADEVMYSSIPQDDTHDIVYKLQVTQNQPAGLYTAAVNFLAIPVY